MPQTTPELAQVIAAYVAAARERDDPEHEAVREIAERHGALMLYAGWTGWLAIRPTGELLYIDDQRRDFTEPVEPMWITVALLKGTRKFPELAALLPRRSQTSVDCSLCKGTGAPIPQLPKIGCGVCGGIGFVDPP